MSRRQWAALRVGDIVVEARSRTPRIVLGVSFGRTARGRREYTTIAMRMIHLGSWRARRGCTMTILTEHDWRHRLSLVNGKQARVTNKMRQCCDKHGDSYSLEGP